tara:strand:- start:1852 stop:2034 length:183 start_codon:yes stop_codon:yes gene_type:complete
MIYFSFKLEAEMERKFVTIETFEDDGTVSEEVVEIFEATNADWLEKFFADVAALDDENEG